MPPPVHGAALVGKYIHESEIINNGRSIHFINLGISKTVNEIGRNPFTKIGRYVTLLFRVIKELVVFKPSSCYLTLTSKGAGFYKDAIIALLIKMSGKKLILHFHNKGVSERQDKTLDDYLYKMVFKNSEVILLSKYLYSDVEKYVKDKQVHYCPNGIPELAEDGNNDSVPESSQSIKVLFLSNLIESKGVFTLLEACRILKKREVQFECIFVGGEGDITKDDFENKVSGMDLQNNVQYAGPKYDKEKVNAFRNANIFAFPTYYHNECFPLVLLEAMQFGLSIVTTPEGGIRDIVQDVKNGFLVPQNDAVALANKLELLIKDPELRKEMGQEGRRLYEEKFTLEAFEKRFDQILHNIEKKDC